MTRVSWQASAVAAGVAWSLLVATLAVAKAQRGGSLEVESAVETRVEPSVTQPTGRAPAPTVEMDEPKSPPTRATPVARPETTPASFRASVAKDEEGPPHRLQQPFPDHNVVVCLAGCPAGREQIVFFERRVPFKSAAYRPSPWGGEPMLQLAQATMAEKPEPAAPTTAAPAPSGTSIQCVAGCYSTPKGYTGRRNTTDGSGVTAGRVPDATWLTAKDQPDTGSPRMTRAGKRGARPMDGDSTDWFTKRF